MAARGRHGCRTSRSMNTRKFIYLCLQTLRLFKSRKRARQLDCNSFLFNLCCFTHAAKLIRMGSLLHNWRCSINRHFYRELAASLQPTLGAATTSPRASTTMVMRSARTPRCFSPSLNISMVARGCSRCSSTLTLLQSNPLYCGNIFGEMSGAPAADAASAIAMSRAPARM